MTSRPAFCVRTGPVARSSHPPSSRTGAQPTETAVVARRRSVAWAGRGLVRHGGLPFLQYSGDPGILFRLMPELHIRLGAFHL
jgi:hypothetical protein